jgi:hypothetical protein
VTAQRVPGISRVWLPNRWNVPIFSGFPAPIEDAVLDAAGEAEHMVGAIVWADGGSHTISAAGGGSITFQVGAATITFADAGTTIEVSIQDLDATGNPAHGNGTKDVYGTLTGGTDTLTALATKTVDMTSGTKTIADGDHVAVVIQMTARGGTDLVRVRCLNPDWGVFPANSFEAAGGGSWSLSQRFPHIKITADDGTLGTIDGCFWFVSAASVGVTWDNATTTKEYGNIFQLPFPVTVRGFWLWLEMEATTTDIDVHIYSDPLNVGAGVTSLGSATLVGTECVRLTTNQWIVLPLATPITLSKDVDYAMVVSPTTTGDVSFSSFNVDAQADWDLHDLGSNCYGVSRDTIASTTPFASVASGVRRYGIGLIVSAFDDGAGGSGTTIAGTPMRRGMV